MGWDAWSDPEAGRGGGRQQQALVVLGRGWPPRLLPTLPCPAPPTHPPTPWCPCTQALGDVFSALSAAVGAADKVVELMRRQPALPPSGTLEPPSFQGRVELRDVVFAYPARPQLR